MLGRMCFRRVGQRALQCSAPTTALLILMVASPSACWADDLATYEARMMRDPEARKVFERFSRNLAEQGKGLDAVTSVRTEAQAKALFGSTGETPPAVQQTLAEVQDGGPRKSTEPPANFPVPVFRGNGSVYTTSSAQLPNGAGVVVVRTNDAPAAVASWYRQALQSSRYQVREVTESGAPGYASLSLLGTQGDRYCNVHISGRTGQAAVTTIQVSCGTKGR